MRLSSRFSFGSHRNSSYLQIQYEDAEPIYVESSTNNNVQKALLKSTPVTCTLPSRVSVVPRCTPVLTPKHNTDEKVKNPENDCCDSRRLKLNIAKDTKSSKSKSQSRELDNLSRQNETTRIKLSENVHKIPTVRKVNSRHVQAIRSNGKVECTTPRLSESVESERKLYRNEGPPTVRKLNETESIESTDDAETFNDTRGNIKKLKAALASRKEKFFYGSDTSHSPQSSPPQLPSEIAKSRILTQVKSKDYEPHKPASHKTQLEPKQTTIKSPVQYNTGTLKSTRNSSQKSPYSNMPVALREAVIQPKVLNPNSESFFEASLWKREKAICISKMRKSNSNDFTSLIPRKPPQKIENDFEDKTESAESNQTYTLARDTSKETEILEPGNFTDETVDITASTITRSKSLQALKDSLHRASDIVRSTPPQTDSSTSISSPFKSPRNFDVNTDSNGKTELLFEDIYQLRHSDGQIRSIERSMISQDSLFATEINDTDIDNNLQDKKVKRRSILRDESRPNDSLEQSRLSSFTCESIAEHLNENDTSTTYQSKPPIEKSIILSRSPMLPLSVCPLNNEYVVPYIGENEEDGKLEAQTGFSLMYIAAEKDGCIGCFPVSARARRRSLPVALSQLNGNPALGKLPIRKMVSYRSFFLQYETKTSRRLLFAN